MAAWKSEEWDIQKLRNLVMFSWDLETKKKAIDALVSYRKTALPALTDIASTVWDNELRAVRLGQDKGNQ